MAETQNAETRVGPHDFEPLRRVGNKGRCRACLLHEEHHGSRLPNWPLARGLGDRRTPLRWEEHFTERHPADHKLPKLDRAPGGSDAS